MSEESDKTLPTGGDDGVASTSNRFEDDADSFVDDMEEIDDERTLDEDEAAEEDDANELANLEAENELSVEELMRKYYGTVSNPSADATDGASSSARASRKRPHAETTDDSNSGMAVARSHSDSNSGMAITEGGMETTAGVSESAKQHGYFSDTSGSDNDEDYQPPEAWMKTINIGDEYQACLPEYSSTRDGYNAIRREADLELPLWRAPDNTAKNVVSYLKSIYADRPALNSPRTQSQSVADVPDDEDALYVLLKSNLDCTKAAEQYRNLRRQQDTLRHVADTILPSERCWAAQVDVRVRNKWPDYKCWNEHETDLFEHGLKEYGKDFARIQREFIPHRSVRDLVYFYYIWKKTERHDMFVERCRLEKRQFAMHPFTTDYTDHFLDEVETVAHNSMRAQQHNLHSNNNNNQNQMLISSDRNSHHTHFNQWHHQQQPQHTGQPSDSHKLVSAVNGNGASLVEHLISQGTPPPATLPLIDMHTVENLLKE